MTPQENIEAARAEWIDEVETTIEREANVEEITTETAEAARLAAE